MYENYDLMPLHLPPPLNKNGIKYNNSISNLSNDILSKHLIVLFIFIFTIIDFLLRQIRFWGFSKTLTGLKVLVFEVLIVRWPSGGHMYNRSEQKVYDFKSVYL